VAQVLRDCLREGRWQKTVPGRNRLAEELGVNHKTAGAALRILEAEGLLEAQGPGRERKIMHNVAKAPVALRIKIFAYEKSDLMSHFFTETLHRLQSAGHIAEFATKTLSDLGMDVKRIARFVAKTEADAWIVVAGSKDVLSWFASQRVPTFAMFGNSVQLPLASASPKKSGALVELVNRLVGFGHHRIVMLAREDRRQPTPGVFEQIFIAQLETHGIRTGSYNLPDWGDHPEDLRQHLGSLFRHTPPTALIVDDTQIFLAVVQHLARLGIAAPENISLACTDSSSTFEWCRPKVTHITWNHRSVIKHVVKWADRLSRGIHDRSTKVTRANLVLGGTIGPVPETQGLQEGLRETKNHPWTS